MYIYKNVYLKIQNSKDSSFVPMHSSASKQVLNKELRVLLLSMFFKR